MNEDVIETPLFIRLCVTCGEPEGSPFSRTDCTYEGA